MSHENRNRGKRSEDDRLFGAKALVSFKEALKDYCFLLSRGYGQKSSVQLVGNRYRFNARQQQALMNMGASDEQVALRQSRSISTQELKGQQVCIDGFNLIITLESYISGAFLFKGADGFFRDISSVHGSYKRIAKTVEVIEEVGRKLDAYGVNAVRWILDKPVSNSGRLKQLMEQIADEHHWNWEVALDFNPDKFLIESKLVAISSDAWILDQAAINFNFLSDYFKELSKKENIVQLDLLD